MGLRTWALALYCLASMSAPAAAHPHVFVDAKAGFTLNETGQLSSLKITWIYDAFTSLKLISILDLDQDNDGALSRADLDRIVLGQTVWPDEFEGDTYLESAGRAVALGRPENGRAAMTDARISVSFDLPLSVPLDMSQPAELRLYDPTYYFAYSTIEVSEDDTCTVELIPFESDGATSQLQATLALLSREETPEQENVGRLFADVVRLQCP